MPFDHVGHLIVRMAMSGALPSLFHVMLRKEQPRIVGSHAAREAGLRMISARIDTGRQSKLGIWIHEILALATISTYWRATAVIEAKSRCFSAAGEINSPPIPNADAPAARNF